MTLKRRWPRRVLNIVLILLLLMNVFAAIHAYKFTHFGEKTTMRTKDDSKMSAGEKLSAIAFGVSIPRPVNDKTPAAPFRTIRIDSGRRLEAWILPAAEARGTVIIFHGYGGCRSGMLAKAGRIRQMGYTCVVPDFRGAGGSEGRSCTIGYREADEVRIWYNHIRRTDTGAVCLMGQSMGAAAIMKAMHDAPMQVSGLILECPYGSMLRTVENRFHSMNVPTFPMATLLVFWGGAQHGFNAFSLRPEAFAKSLNLPVLLIRGTDDPRVSLEETDAIYRNLPGPKVRLELLGAGHNDFLETNATAWDAAVRQFLDRH